MDLSEVFVFWDLMDADVDTQTNISRTFCSICQNHVDVQMKIPECCFHRRIVFIALPLFGDWKKCVSEHSVLLIHALMPSAPPHAHYKYCLFGSGPFILHLSPFIVCLPQTSL